MIVADTSALFAILAAEAEAQLFLDRMTSAREVLLSAATLAELGVVVSSRWPMDGMSRLDGLMGLANVRIVPVDEEASRDVVAAHLRFGRGRNHPARLNFGDCFSYALAKRHDLPLLFKGNDFSRTDLSAAIPAA